MLARPAAELCGSCHAPIAKRIASSGAHTAAAQGKCAACHEPHGAKGKGLLKGTPKQLCASCHPDVGKGDHVHQPTATA